MAPAWFPAGLPSILVGLALLAAGNGLRVALRCRARSGPEALGLALCLGASLLGVLAVVLGAIAQFRLVPVGLALLACALLPLLPRARRADRNGPMDAEAEPGTWQSGWIGFLPALAVVGLSFWLAGARPVWNIDAQRRWVLHGQWLADTHTPAPERVEEASWAPSHPTYPPLVPAAVALALELGADRDTGLRPLFPWFLLALVAVVFGHARRVAGLRAAPWIALALALTPALAWMRPYGLGADTAHADVALAALLTALSVLLLARLAADGGAERGGSFAACALLAAGAALTKKEGTAFVLAMLVATVVWLALASRADARRRGVRGTLVATAGALAAALAWAGLSARLPVEVGEDYLSAGALGALAEGLDRLPTVAARIGAELADLDAWGLIWFLPLVWLALELVRLARGEREGVARRLLPGLWLAVGFAMVFAPYLVTGWKGGSYEKLMDVSLARLLLHHAPLAALMLAQCLERGGEPRARPVDA